MLKANFNSKPYYFHDFFYIKQICSVIKIPEFEVLDAPDPNSWPNPPSPNPSLKLRLKQRDFNQNYSGADLRLLESVYQLERSPDPGWLTRLAEFTHTDVEDVALWFHMKNADYVP